jgi:sulfoxide reductase heme-binding subunit YedZ
MRKLKPVLFLSCLVPITLLVQAAVNGQLSANPLEDIRDTTGIWTLRFLILTLMITPFRRISRWHGVIRLRRMLGLFAFFYAVLHFVSYVWLDQFFALDEMIEDLTQRPFIMAGYAGFVLLVPLAVTSTKKWIGRLGGERWQMLHRLIYVSAAAGVVHYFWRVKSDIRSPVAYGAVLAILLAARWIPKSEKDSSILKRDPPRKRGSPRF